MAIWFALIVASAGTDAYRQGRYARASELLASELVSLSEQERGGPLEINLREKLVLSLYAAKKEPAAVAEYKELKRRFPGFAFDPDRVSPETLSFFDSHDDKHPTVGASAGARELPPASQPRVVQSPAPAPTPLPGKKEWRWYYLAPLGIGQFLAGSPVRGSIIAAVQIGFIVLDAVAYSLLAPQIKTGGAVANLPAAQRLQVMANVGFFGWIGALVLGTLDGAFLEP